MSIFNWYKNKKEEQKKQVTQQKKTPVIVAVAEKTVSLKSNKETEVVVSTPSIEEKPRATGGAHRVLLRPLLTEKNTLHQTQNQYVFEVAKNTNKVEVKKAVESVFKVKVIKVRIVSMRGKVKQFGRRSGTRKAWKKAMVTVGKGDHITLLSSV
ncbi:MAG: 50S ribosomal protein L23 [Candidatus Magasanikbacteria bacterium]|nr:50S ribosomal protein L23 [Candidatus Magasanikbacteria bacterium]